jgi:hypothetical protein
VVVTGAVVGPVVGPVIRWTAQVVVRRHPAALPGLGEQRPQPGTDEVVIVAAPGGESHEARR